MESNVTLKSIWMSHFIGKQMFGSICKALLLNANQLRKFVGFFLLGIYILTAQTSNAQTAFATVGTSTGTIGATTAPNPFGNNFTTSRGQYLVTAAELNASGVFGPTTLHSIGINITSIPSGTLTCGGGQITASTQHNNFTVKIKTTAATSFASTSFDNASLTTVRASSTYNVVLGWNTFTFPTPFSWDGTSSILVDICHDNANGATPVTCYSNVGSGTVDRLITTNPTSLHAWIDNAAASYCGQATGNLSTTRPIFRVEYTPPPMVFVSSTTTHPNLLPLLPGSTNQQIARVEFVTSGTASPFNLTQLSFNTNGTSNTAGISNAKVYYTGTSTTFSTATQFGSTVNTPNGGFSVNGSQELVNGTNYFWLVYDITSSAQTGSVFDAEGNSITYNSSTITPTIQAPAGNRTIKSPLNGVYAVGVGGDYATLTEAVQDLNGVGVSGPVTLSLTDAVYNTAKGEVFPITIGNPSGVSASNNVVIKPADGVQSIITDNIATALIILDGSGNITIDGRRNNLDTMHFLTIENRLAANNATCIQLINDASNNTIRNTIIRSANNNTNTFTQPVFGAVYIGRTNKAIPFGNDNNNIVRNVFSRTSTGAYTIGVVSDGQSLVAQNNNNNIDSNWFNGATLTAVLVTGNNSGNGSNWNIRNNSFYDTATTSTTNTLTAIDFIPGVASNSINNEISSNSIGGTSPYLGGTAAGLPKWTFNTSATGGFNGISVSAGVGATFGVRIEKNRIANMQLQNTASLYTFIGIRINQGTALIGGAGNGNYIGHPTENGNINVSSASTTTGIFSSTTNDVTISNNIISGLNASGVGTSVSLRGILVQNGSSNTLLVDNNLIRNFVTASTTTGTTISSAIVGIGISSSSANQTISNNTIGGLNIADALIANGLTNARAVGITATSGVNTISNNTVANIWNRSNQTGTITSAAIIGIGHTSFSNGSLITGNTVMGLDANAAAGTSIIGILSSSGALTISNNTLYDFRSNSTSTSTGTSAALNGINISTNNAHTVTGNTIYNLWAYNAAGHQTNGIVTLSANNISNNTIRNFRSSGTAAFNGNIIGINCQASGANQIIEGNSIHSLISLSSALGSHTITGIAYSGSVASSGNNSRVSRNTIHSFGINNTSTTAAVLNGIIINSGSVMLSNNAIRLGRDTTGTTITRAAAIRGIISVTAGTIIHRIYHNNIYIEAAPSAGASITSAIEIPNSYTAPGLLDIRNNVIVNNTATAFGSHYNLRLPIITTNITADNNIYFNQPGTNRFIGQRGVTNYTTLANHKSGFLLDAVSGYGDPQFVNATGNSLNVNLRLSGSNPAEASGDASVITFVSDDIDGNVRSSNTPVDIGASSSTGTISNDIIAPSVVYTALTNTPITSNITLNATIVDNVGVKVLVDNARIYFRKNAGSWFSTEGVLTSGTYSNGNWQFTIDASLIGTPVTGDTIRYYIIAQDSAVNINSNVMYAVATNVNNVTTHPATPLFYRITDPILTSLTVPGVPPNGYPTLTGTGGLFEAINNSMLQGNTVVQLTGNVTEPGLVQLNQWLETGGSGYTLTIRPQTTTQVVLSSIVANNNGVIRIGAERVRILGYPSTITNPTSADTALVIRSTNTFTPALGLIDRASNDSFVNVIFESRVTSTLSGVFFISNATTLTGINNIDIRGCHLRQDLTASTSYPSNCFYASGTSPRLNTGIRIIGSSIYNFGSTGINVASGNGNSWVINDNHFFRNATPNFTNTTAAIAFSPGTTSDGNTINGNYFGGSRAFALGNPYTSTAGGFTAINVSTGVAAGTIINNNKINNITLTGATGVFNGISVSGTSANYVVNGNRIGSASSIPNSVLVNSNTRSIMFNSTTSGNITLSNDTCINIINSGLGTSVSLAGITVSSGSGNTTIIENNFIEGLKLTGTSVGTSALAFASVVGIQLTSSSTNQSITGNTIRSLFSGASVNNQMLGIYNSSGLTTINNNSVTGIRSASTSISTTTNASIIGILNGSTATGSSVTSGNTVDSLALIQVTPAGSQMIGILHSSISSPSIINNTVSRLSSSTSSTSIGVLSGMIGVAYNSTGANANVSQNKIHSFYHTNSATSTSLIGLFYSGSTLLTGNTSIINANFIHSFKSDANAASPMFTGIQNAGGIASYTNNMVRLGMDENGGNFTIPTTIRGIFQTTSLSNNYYHNTILLAGDPAIGGSGTPNTSGFEAQVQIASGSILDFRNNIIVNKVNNSGSSGKNWCVKYADSLRINSNYNLYLFDGSGGLLAGTNLMDYPTLNDANGWKEMMGLDLTSGFGDPGFVTAAFGDASVAILNLQNSNAAEKSGDPTLTAVTTDYYGNLRSGLTPADIGAHAGNFNINPDLTPPVITFTPLSNTGTLTGSRTLTGVVITDNNGIPTAGVNRPKIYYSKDGSTWYNSSATSVSGAATNATADFVIDYTPMLPLTLNDTIRYYVLVQDNAGNVMSNAAYAIASGVNSVTNHPINPNRYTFLPVIPANTVFEVGAGKTYTSLTGNGGFFEFINSRTLGGNIFVDVTSNLTETGVHALNPLAEDGAGGFSLFISPESGVSSVLNIAGSSSNALIRINGANRVKFTGIPRGSSGNQKFLRVRNNGNAAAIEIQNGANGCKLSNLICEAGPTAFTTGVVALITNSGTIPCSNDTITNCNITNNTALTFPAGIPSFGFYSNGLAGIKNNGIVISNNEISNFSNSGIVLDNNNGNNWTMSNNSLFNSLPISITTNQYIAFNIIPGVNGSGYLISNNFIGGSAPLCGGSPWSHTGNTSFTGIRSVTGTGANTIISNNTIQNINFTVTSTNQFLGISATGGNTIIGGTTAEGNLIGSNTNPSSIIYTSYTGNFGINYSGSNNITVNGNTISGLLIGSAGQGSGFTGINVSNGTVLGISNNTIGSTTLANSITNLGNTTLIGIAAGPAINLSPSYTVNNNIVSNLFGQGSQSSVSVYGIQVSNTATANVLNNQINNLTSNTSNNNTVSTNGIIGIRATMSTNAICNIQNNVIYALRALNTGNVNTNVTGILVSTGQTPLVSSNRIYDLTNASTSTSTNPTPSVSGITLGQFINVKADLINNQITLGSGSNNTQYSGIWLQLSTTSVTLNALHNSILINGTAIGNQNTYAFLRGNNTGFEQNTFFNLKNNILVNIRTGGTGRHFAISNQTTSPTATTWLANSSDYNLMVTSNANNVGEWGLTAMNIGAWRTASNSDFFSYYLPSGIGAGQLNVANMFVNPTLGDLGLITSNPEVWYVYGKAIAGSASLNINTDYYATTRGTTLGFANTIGAMQLNALPSSAPIPAVASATPASNTSVVYTFASRNVATINWGSSAPTTATLLNYSGVNPIGTAPAGNNLNQYLRVNVSGGTAPYNFGVTFNYDPALIGSVTSPANLKISQDNGGTVSAPTWSTSLTNTVNTSTRTITSTGLSSTIGFNAIHLTGTENAAPPSITAFTPSAREVGGAVTIRGSLFTGATEIAFNGVNQPVFTVVNDTSITTTVPTGATTGTVTVTNTYGTGTSPINFTVIPVPTVSTLSSSSGTVGSAVTITGTGFTWATGVTFGGVNAIFNVVNNTTITCTVPSGAVTGTVSVINPAGSAVSSTNYTVIGVPVITSFTPSTAPAGSTVTINGSNFQSITGVTFNGVAASYVVNSSTQIVATVPNTATTGLIAITNGSGTGSSAGNFVVQPLPTITGFTPSSGSAGTSVVINGTNFIGVDSIRFGTTKVTTFTVNSTSQITAIVPNGSSTGLIQVYTTSGSTTSASSFTIIPDLIVSTVTSVSGTYANIVVTSTGDATLSGSLIALGNVTVQSGGKLRMGNQILSGNGNFTLEANSQLYIGSAQGLSATGGLTGNIQINGTRSYNNAATYIYNGTVGQITGLGLPTNIDTLIISNNTGVSLSQSTTIARNVSLGNGNLNLGNSNLTLAVNATITNASISGYIGTVENSVSGGSLRRTISTASGIVHFPVGSASSNFTYTPAWLTLNTGTTDVFSIRVFRGLLRNGTNGNNATSNALNRSWVVAEDISGGSNLTVEFQWQDSMELASLNRGLLGIVTNNGIGWNVPSFASFSAATGTNPYSLSRSGVSSLGVFSIIDSNAIINPLITGNSITGIQTVCSGSLANPITGSSPAGGSGSNYSYLWISSTTSATAGFDVAGGVNNLINYTPQGVTQNTWFRRVVRNAGTINDTSTSVLITVNNPITSNSITSGNQNICSGTIPATMTGSTPSGGNGSTYTYSWISSNSGAFVGYTAIPASNLQNYNSSSLTSNSWFRRIVTSGVCAADTSAPIAITVIPAIAGNTIGSDQSILINFPANSLTGSLPTGGIGTYSYSWLISTISATQGFTAIPSTDSLNHTPSGVVSQNTWYRRVVNSGSCSDTSAVVSISVNTSIAGNTISSSQTICTGTAPATLTGGTVMGGNGTFTYLWISSTTGPNSGLVAASGTNNNPTYTPPSLTVNTWYRRYVVSGTDVDTSAAILITINAVVANNTITNSAQTICSGNSPTQITGTLPTGGNGTNYSYLWLSSTSSGTAGFSPAGGANTNQNYSSGTLTQTTWFRRRVVSGACQADTAVAYVVTVNQPISNNTITSSGQIICSGANSGLITATAASGGNGSTYSYSWLASTVSATSGFGVVGGNIQNYTSGAITQNTWFRRRTVSGLCSADTSAAILFTVNQPIANNVINTAPQTVCFGQAPAVFNASIPTGGNGSSYTYTWLVSNTSAVSGFTPIASSNLKDYTSPAV
ncbi:MAG: BNR-repeat neuraminidase N-terminal domain-containing protein, partial [Bacteroidota bacterium]